MSDLKANLSPRRFISIESLLLVMVLGITSSSVYFLQQKRIEHLQAQNQALQQQIATLQADNINQQRTIEGLNAAKTTLTANLQLLCQQRPTRIGLFFKSAFNGLMENGSDNFAEKWQQICGSSSTSPVPLQ
jgi:hypothetical protein